MDTERRIQRNKVTIAGRRGRRRGKRHVEEKQKKKVKGGKGGGGGEVRELAVRLGSVRFFFRRNRDREAKDLPTGQRRGRRRIRTKETKAASGWYRSAGERTRNEEQTSEKNERRYEREMERRDRERWNGEGAD